MEDIGGRVGDCLRRLSPAARQRDIAEHVGMTPDAFSRALNGKRAFASIELARLADLLDADLHWLITGIPDPQRLVVAARHDFDHTTGHRDVPGREPDNGVLHAIGLAYRQAYPAPVDESVLPGTAGAAREALGEGFVRPFADRLEARLGVDVVRVSELSTAYSIAIGGHRVIALPATGNWFRENWDLAHELGHLTLGHHDLGWTRAESDRHEAAANRFAAELLVPREALEVVDWDSLDVAGLADCVWRWGVSSEALGRRLDSTRGVAPLIVREWAVSPTQRLLRRHWVCDSGEDEITLRMDAAAQRRFPLALQEAHLKAIATGRLGRGTLSWMLAIHPDALEVDTPVVHDVDVDAVAESLGL